MLSLLKGRSFADPDRLADDCNFDGLEDLASAAAEAALKDLGFSRDDFAEVHGCTRLTKTRFVQRWKANSGAQTPQRKRPPPSRQKGVAEALAKQRKVQSETASGRPPRMNLDGGPSDALKPKGPRREEDRRVESEQMGEKANARLHARAAAMASFAPLSAREGAEVVDSHLHRQAQQQFLGLQLVFEYHAQNVNLYW